MARPREFDVDKVLGEAMEVFWEKGFDGASFADLEARTGVRKASLFAAYGDKRGLFLKALQHYQEGGREMCRVSFGGRPPREAIRDWFLTIAGTAKGHCARRGCFQVNTIVELAPHDPEVARLLAEGVEQMRALVAATIRRGQAAGEFRKDVSATKLASYLLASAYGLAVAGKASLPERDIDAAAEIVLAALEG